MKNQLVLIFWSVVFTTIFHHSAYAQMSIDAQRSAPACEGQCNGTLTLKVEPGTVVPLIVRLKPGSEADVQTNIVSEVTFTGLCEGTKYLIEISSEHPAGCKTNTMTYTVPKAPLSIVTKEVKSPNFDNTSDGVIEIDVIGSKQGNYNIQWNNGATTKRIENLPGGVYEVSVTDSDWGCTLTQAFQLQPCHTEGPIDEGATSPDFEVKFTGKLPQQTNEPQQLKAFIRFDPTDLFQTLPAEYSAKWYIEGQLVGIGNIFNAPGNFTGANLTLEVTDPCGVFKTYSNTLINCKSSKEDFAKYFISKTEPPCGPNLEGGVHFEFNGTKGEEIQLEIVQDGSGIPIFSGINRNPSNNDGATYIAYIGGLESAKEYRIKGFLGDNCPVDFTFTIPYQPPQRRFVEYRKKSFLCVYDEYCNGKLLEPPKNYREAAFIDFDKSKIKEPFEDGNLFARCRGTILCRDGNTYRKVEERPGWTWVSGLEWQRMLIKAGYGLEDSPDFQRAVANPCAIFNVCAYDPGVADVAGWETAAGALFKGCKPGEDNCLICDCSIESHKICVDNFITPPPRPPSKPIVQLSIDVEVRSEDEKLPEVCQHEEKGLLQMVDWHQRGKLAELWDGSKGDHLKYTGSMLEERILDHIFSDPRVNRDIRCARIVFCKNDLNREDEIVTTFPSDIQSQSIQCGQRIPGKGFAEYCGIKLIKVNGITYEDYDGKDPARASFLEQLFANNFNNVESIVFRCFNSDGTINLDRNSSPQDFIGGNETSLVSNDHLENIRQLGLIEPLIDSTLVNVNISDTLALEKLIDFAYIRYKGVFHTEGLLETNEGKTFLDFSYLDQQVLRKKSFPSLKHYTEYWDTGQNLYAYDLIPEKELGIMYEDTLGQLNSTLVSDQSLKLSNMAIVDTNFVITGYTKGNLSLDSNLIGNISHYSMFILELTRRGQINRFHILEGIDTLQGAVFTEIRNGVVGVGVKYTASQTLSLNGNPVTTTHNDGVLFATSQKDTFTLIKDLAVGSEVHIKKASLSKNASQVAFVLSHVDSLNLSSQTVTAGDNLVLGTMSTTGFLKWSRQFPDSVLNTSKLDLTHGDSTQVFLGLSFSDTLAFQNQFFHPQGDEDVLILKFGFNGDLSFAKSYGSASKETVTHLFYDSGLLVFGGDLQGNTPERVLGMFKIINHTNHFNRAYMAALLDTLDQTGEIAAIEVAQEGLKTIPTTQPKETKSTALGKELLINVYPNPFRNEFTLEINTRQSEVLTISLSDNLGKTMQQNQMPVNIGYNAQVLNTSALPTGIYFLYVKDRSGRLIKTHRVVKL